ncbi:MAG TPA: MBL fold metallo-hydrolase [Ilumatobacteraceae bacterium]
MTATPIPFVPPIEVSYGDVVELSPLVRRIVAENPSKYTYLGTGTYIVGHGDVAVIDPGPDLVAHRDALAAALVGERVRAILVTHCHADHSPLAAWLRNETGAPTCAFGPHGEVEQLDDESKPGESIDVDFLPDETLADGALVDGPGWTFEAVHTPGHTSNHMCFALREERTLFTGDHVMGWSTTVITPPDGDMRAYCASLEKLLRRPTDELYRPTHGGPITEPRPFVEAYLAHRLEREAQVLGALRSGLTDIPAIVAKLYADVREELHQAAGRSVFAHLVKLVDDGAATVDGDGPPRIDSVYLA